MKITYIYPPLFKPFYPMATRMITENLLRNKNIEAQFSDVPVKTYSSNIHNTIHDNIMAKAASKFSPNILSFLSQKFMANNMFYVFMTYGYYNDYIFQNSDNKYVIVTCINFCDLIIVKHFLENNKKVVVGGPLINIDLSARFIRDFLNKMGVDQSKLAHNLIVVSGNIDLSTDLHEILRNWRDTKITCNNYETIYDCERDFLQEYYDSSSSIPVHVGFNNRCWYGKCRFCTYKKLPAMDFLTNVEDVRVISYIRNLMNRFGSEELRFVDSYYHCNSPSVQNILEEIKNYHMTIYTGIKLLKSKDYVDFLSKYVNCLLIGLETTSDFSLDSINKGYTYEDIMIAVDNIVRHLDKRVFLEISIILDLPYRNEEDVKRNYANIVKIQQRLIDEGFRVGIHMNILSVFPNLELLYVKDSLLRVGNGQTNLHYSSGKNYMVGLLRESGMDNSLLLPPGTLMLDRHNAKDLHYGYISSDLPIVRYDVNGKVLPSDLNLIDEAVMRQLLERKSRRLG